MQLQIQVLLHVQVQRFALLRTVLCTVVFSSSATGTDSKTLYRAEAAGQRTEARGLTCQFQPINVSPGQYLSPSQRRKKSVQRFVQKSVSLLAKM